MQGSGGRNHLFAFLKAYKIMVWTRFYKAIYIIDYLHLDHVSINK